ncbi:MAG: hypothetical protein PHO15_09025 [Eubacteriales bacterium]|nr:hypothetical protein [Eubacteriales bacterium]
MFDNAQPQADEPANQPEYETAADGGGVTEDFGSGGDGVPFLTVRYNKEDKPLSKEAAVAYAQKGMNYDKLSRRLKEAGEKLGAYENNDLFKAAKAYAGKNGKSVDEVMAQMRTSVDMGNGGGEGKQARINGQLGVFMRRNPGVDPRCLPRAVMEQWRRGVPLSEAYLNNKANELSQKTRSLEKQLAQEKANQKNTAASMGKAMSSGPTHFKPLTEEAIASMTPQELEKNHNRIWAMLTGTK